MTYDTQVQNVVVPFPRTADSWPLSGSIARHVVVKIVGGPHDGETRDRTTVVTFNGTELVPIQVNGVMSKLPGMKKAEPATAPAPGQGPSPTAGGVCPTCGRGYDPGIKTCPVHGDDLVPARERAPGHGANHRVQAGTIPAAREHADLHASATNQ